MIIGVILGVVGVVLGLVGAALGILFSLMGGVITAIVMAIFLLGAIFFSPVFLWVGVGLAVVFIIRLLRRLEHYSRY